MIQIKDAVYAADLIFIISDGAYYYLSMEKDINVYNKKIKLYEKEAYRILLLQYPEEVEIGAVK